MRWCDWFAQWLNPGPPFEVEEEMEPLASLACVSRRCHNVKSQKNPDVQCPLAATTGDYCFRHYKNPRPFKLRILTDDSPPSKGVAAVRLQRFWRRLVPLRRWKSQGPAANDRTLSMNDTELYSFDPLSSIPSLYFISFADSHKTIWSFDLRTLAHSIGVGLQTINPYTRDTLSQATQEFIHHRIAWLRQRGYQVRHIAEDILTPEQIWNQRVLDVFLKIEALGYYASCDWFHALRVFDHAYLYRKLLDLWVWRLELTEAQQEEIVPGWRGGGTNHILPLFPFGPDANLEKSRAWWQRTNLGILEALVSRAPGREQQKLGAMYILMGLVQVSRTAAVALPWVVELVF